MSDDCKAESTPKKFCSIRAEKNCDGCGASKNYREVCSPEGWADVSYKQLLRLKTGTKSFDKSYEAHHIMCVSPVTKELLGNKSIQLAVEATKWCINHEPNMIAMPLWGHTVQHYCIITKSRQFKPKDVPAPPFKDLPQHNIDHNSAEGYTYEITKECQALVKEVLSAEHKAKGESLAGRLTSLSGKWRGRINERGSTRKGGTHAAWKSAWGENPDPNWFEPFSMASDRKISRMPFPVHSFDEKIAAWIDRLANAMT